jgi:hypothetical protein
MADAWKMIMVAWIHKRAEEVGLRTAVIELRTALFQAECDVGFDSGANRMARTDRIAKGREE